MKRLIFLIISILALLACSKEELIIEEKNFGEELRTRSITPMTSPLFNSNEMPLIAWITP